MDLLERLKGEMAAEFARTEPPSGFPKFPDIPVGRYTSDEFWELERRHLWSRAWVLAGRADDVAEPGDYLTFDDLGVPVVLVRGADHRVRAFYNTCQHRGAPVVREARGTARTLRCQYHSWTYDITDGSLLHVPDERDFVGLCRDERALVEIGCDVWDGWIFVNQAPDALPLRDHLGPIVDEMSQFQGETLRTISVQSDVVTCNWKVTAEAFLEVYHFRHIHSRKGGAALDGRGATMGLLPNGCSRMITPFSKAACAAKGMRDWADWQPLVDEGFVDIPTVNEMVRSTSSAFFLFPNLITPVASSGFPFVLFWPIDKRTTRIDWIHYGPKEWEEDAVPLHWQDRLDRFAVVMGEDIQNMAPMQRSLESPGMRGVPINYQERRIWHFNEEVDLIIGRDRIPEHLRVAPLLSDYVERERGVER